MLQRGATALQHSEAGIASALEGGCACGSSKQLKFQQGRLCDSSTSSGSQPVQQQSRMCLVYAAHLMLVCTAVLNSFYSFVVPYAWPCVCTHCMHLW
jgi:hypothetical protein